MLLFDIGSILIINQRESEKTVWRADLDKKIYNAPDFEFKTLQRIRF